MLGLDDRLYTPYALLALLSNEDEGRRPYEAAFDELAERLNELYDRKLEFWSRTNFPQQKHYYDAWSLLFALNDDDARAAKLVSVRHETSGRVYVGEEVPSFILTSARLCALDARRFMIDGGTRTRELVLNPHYAEDIADPVFELRFIKRPSTGASPEVITFPTTLRRIDELVSRCGAQPLSTTKEFRT